MITNRFHGNQNFIRYFNGSILWIVFYIFFYTYINIIIYNDYFLENAIIL